MLYINLAIKYITATIKAFICDTSGLFLFLFVLNCNTFGQSKSNPFLAIADEKTLSPIKLSNVKPLDKIALVDAVGLMVTVTAGEGKTYFSGMAEDVTVFTVNG